MKKNLPGLPTVAALMLTTVLATWLCLAGPPNLKDWQTLIAAFIALGGGTLAYRGAMAKVNFDRDMAQQELRRRQLSLLLKADLAARKLHDRARWVDALVAFSDAPEVETLWLEKLTISEPDGFDDAWANLDVFPRTVIKELYDIRQAFLDLPDIWNRLASPGGTSVIVMDAPSELAALRDLAQIFWQSCSVLRHELAPLIQQLAPTMSEDERMEAIFGIPFPDDELDEE